MRSWICLLVLGAMLGAAARGAPLKIMPVGDSITAGYTDNPQWKQGFSFGYRKGLYERLKRAGIPFVFVGESTEPFAGLAKASLPEGYQPAFDLRPLGQGAHNGYGGQNTHFVKQHIAEWLKATPADVVLLMIGINDIRRGSSEEPMTAENNLAEIVQTIIALNPETTVIVAQITPYPVETPALLKYNTYIRDVLVPLYTRQGKKVYAVDQFSNLSSDGVKGAIERYANGINHPNEAAYDKMAKTWYDGLVAAGLARK